MRIYLMRHGIAIDREDPDCPPEKERYLTAKGIERTGAVAAGLCEMDIKPTALLTSPYVRAVQTAEIVCQALDLDPKQLRETDALKTEAKPARLAEELSHLSDKEVICFGHGPQLDDFIAYAVKAETAFTALKKAGVACLEISGFSPLQASLPWLLTSRALRRLRD
jgi:phosphohistidine phosphatase